MRSPLMILGVIGGLGCGGTSTPAPSEPIAHRESPADPEWVLQASPLFPPRVYSNDSGVNVSMIFLKGKSDKPRQALAVFTGLLHPLEGKVVRLTEEKASPTSRRWTAFYDGRDRTLLTQKVASGSHDARVDTQLWLPRERISTYLYFNADASQALVPENLIAAHSELRSDGSLKALEALDRSYHRALAQGHVDRAGKSIAQACGAPVPIEINWDSVSDEELANRVPCSSPLEGLTRVCGRDVASRNALVRRIKKVVCSVEGEYQLGLEGTTLFISVTTDPTPRNRVAFDKLHEILELTHTVLRNSAGQFLVFDPEAKLTQEPFHFYLGDQSILHLLRRGLSVDETWDPRGNTPVKKSPDGYVAHCRQGKVEFKPVSDEVRLDLLKTVKFEDRKWKRTEFALARDDRGTYYYVDRYSDKMGGKNFRVFKGPRGQVRETKLMDIVDDSDSMIFSTQKGKLRLVIGKEDRKVQKDDAVWIEGKTRRPLVMLPLEENLDLIYYGLGAYDGDDIGTICD